MSLRRYVFWIGYDGSKFPEMARGGTGLGVMDLLNQTVHKSIYGDSPIQSTSTALKFSPSSRTDARVHAIRNAIICQVPLAHADLDFDEATKRKYLSEWRSTIQMVLPDSLEIKDVHRVSAGFCVRRNVSYRRYTYRLAVAKSWEIWERIREDPSLACFSEQHYAWIIPPGFSPERLRQAGKVFEGEQVMGSFFKHTEREKRKEPKPPSALKYIMHVGVYKGEAYSYDNDIYDYYNVEVIAKSYVREQIRRMMSCLVNYSYGTIDLKLIRWLLKNPISSNFYDRRIPISPPQGLYLTDVVYDPVMFIKPNPYHYHSWDYE